MKKGKKIKNLKMSSNMKQQKYKLDRTGSYLIIFASVVQIITFSVLPKIYYRPYNREMDDSNLFSQNEVIISKEEQKDILKDLEKELGIKIDSDEENYLLLHAVSENPYLSSKEKEIFYKFIEYFNDNPYINREEVYTNILNVNARFSIRSALKKDSNVLAIYLPDYRDIIYFELFPSVDTIAHEDGHCINDSRNLPSCILEGMTLLISSEYFSETPFVLTQTYPYEVSFVKLLCEMIGADKMLQAYTEDKPEIIYQALDQLIGKENNAKEVIEEINWCMTYYNKSKTLTEDDYNRANSAVLSFLDYVNNFEYEDKDAVQYHLSVFVNIFTTHYGTLEDYYKITLCKAYLSSKLQNEFPKTILIRTEDYLGHIYQY